MSPNNRDLIGRDDVNDLEAILAITNTDVDAVVHDVGANIDSIFTWDYERSRLPLVKLYEKAKTSQWNASTDLDWSIDVDQEAVVLANAGQDGGFFSGDIDLSGTPFAKWTEKEWVQLGIEGQNWTLSQFLHGEQGALLCTARIVETVPWIDAKYYAATQMMDEARHVEVFARYLDEKLTGHYPINAHLRLLLDDILADSRWDMTYLGMQIMVEGLALAAFGFMHQMTTEPLLKQLLRYVMSDEARHVAFGVLSLKEYYTELTDAEMQDRVEFTFEAAVRMRDRFLQQEVWDRMGVQRQGRARARHGRRRPADVPEHPVLEDRAELQEARPARPQRRAGCASASPSSASSSSRTGSTPARSTRCSTRSPRTARPSPAPDPPLRAPTVTVHRPPSGAAEPRPVTCGIACQGEYSTD